MPLQTLAYLLPVLSLAIQRAELEYQTAEKKGRPHDVGTLQVMQLLYLTVNMLSMLLLSQARSALDTVTLGCGFLA